MTGPDQVRRAERRIAAGLAVTTLAAAGFAVNYALGGGVQLQGITLGIAFAALSYAFAAWSRHLTPQQEYVEEREPMPSPPAERRALQDALTTAPVARARLVRGMLVVALGTLGAALLFPVRSLLFRGPAPTRALARTPWQDGSRVVTKDGSPVRPEDLDEGTLLTVFPAGYEKSADAPAVLIRVDPRQLRLPADRMAWTVDGIIAYSKLCTHAGCPVGLYAQALQQLLCPCHQSVFTVLNGAVPIAGPAARALPQLPIALGADGALVARGGFSGPVGPGYWSLP
ncbi:MAG: Rieske (2Fe-2S) protein [Actinomycetota bacterium]|nr:Rieske (2Fe-2S) protein [Actinomycetota bacterium]